MLPPRSRAIRAKKNFMSDSLTGAEYIAWEPYWEVREVSDTGLHKFFSRSWDEVCERLYEDWKRFVTDEIRELKLCIVNCRPRVHLHGRIAHPVLSKPRFTVASWKRYCPSNPPVYQDFAFLRKMPQWEVVTSKELQRCTGSESSKYARFPFSGKDYGEGVRAYDDGARAFLAGDIAFVSLELHCPDQVLYYQGGTAYSEGGQHNVADMRKTRYD